MVSFSRSNASKRSKLHSYQISIYDAAAARFALIADTESVGRTRLPHSGYVTNQYAIMHDTMQQSP